MRENRIEARLKTKISRIGGLVWKWVSPGTAGVPDRIVLLPAGKIVFVELKAPGCKPGPLQEHRHKQLRALGFEVRIFDNPDEVDRFVQEVADAI